MNNSEPNTNEKEIQSISFSKALSKVSKKGLLVNKVNKVLISSWNETSTAWMRPLKYA